MRWMWIFALASCARATNEESLGLPGERPVTVDVQHLSTPTELLHALQLPGAEVDKRLGAHRIEVKSSLKVEPAGRPLEKLEESYRLDSDGKGGFHLVHDNARDGLEAAFCGGVLYVKPRYGQWTRRRPEGDDLSRLRDNVESVGAGYVELLQRFLSVKELSRDQKTVKLGLSLGTPESAPTETRANKKWRDTVKVANLNGEWTLDAAGTPLGGKLEATWSFERSDLKGPVVVTLSYEQHAAAPQPIVAPADAVEPRRPRPILERDQLLDGLKPLH
jgi:hypothetical protein